MKNGRFDLKKLLAQSGEWLKGTGPESDVVMSTRVRLARNLSRFPFLTTANPSVRREIETYVRERLQNDNLPKELHYLPLHELPPSHRRFLLERHLISRELAQSEGECGVAFSEDETISVMVNEEDHLRLQVLRSGFQPVEAYEEIQALDDALESRMTFAFHPKYGYVTCCPTNLGTGLRISVMLHLPALVYSKQVEKILRSLHRVQYNIRGFYGEGTSPIGDFFQVSNQVTLGRPERILVEEIRKVVPEILGVERGLREKLLREQRERLEDRIHRAYAILKNCRVLSSEECLELLSALRLGVHLGVLTSLPTSVLNEIFILSHPSHLQMLHGLELSPVQRDVLRATAVREKLKDY